LIHITKVPIMLIGVTSSFCSDPESIIECLKSDKHGFKDGNDEVNEWIEAKRKAKKKIKERWDELLKMVKNHFEDNYVIEIKIGDLEQLKEYRKSPLFLLLAVDNKLSDKYKIWEERNGGKDFELFMKENDNRDGNTNFDFEKFFKSYISFMKENDVWWGIDKNHKLMSIADFTVKSKDDLHKIMLSPVRSTKNAYFMYLAELAASRTNCMSRKVGCVLVKDGYKVIATGYNGTPTGLKHCIEGNCKSCKGEDKEFCKCIHAEENAIMIAGMNAKDCILYCTTPYKGLEEVEELFNEAKEKAEIGIERLSNDSLPPKNFMLYPL
ncbi:1231_t:CDS:2, partial [Dentiscutata heterogama]